MTIKRGDRVKVEYRSFEGTVALYMNGEYVIDSDNGTTHYIEADDPDFTITKIEPKIKAGQVWKDQAGLLWFVISAGHDFHATPVKQCNRMHRAILFRYEFGNLDAELVFDPEES